MLGHKLFKHTKTATLRNAIYICQEKPNALNLRSTKNRQECISKQFWYGEMRQRSADRPLEVEEIEDLGADRIL